MQLLGPGSSPFLLATHLVAHCQSNRPSDREPELDFHLISLLQTLDVLQKLTLPEL